MMDITRLHIVATWRGLDIDLKIAVAQSLPKLTQVSLSGGIDVAVRRDQVSRESGNFTH
jgi:hypothetical protein